MWQRATGRSMILPPLPPQHWQHKSKINIQGQMQVEFPFDKQVSEGYLPHCRVNVWMKTVFPCHLLVGAVVPREMYILHFCKKKRKKWQKGKVLVMQNGSCNCEFLVQRTFCDLSRKALSKPNPQSQPPAAKLVPPNILYTYKLGLQWYWKTTTTVCSSTNGIRCRYTFVLGRGLSRTMVSGTHH